MAIESALRPAGGARRGPRAWRLAVAYLLSLAATTLSNAVLGPIGLVVFSAPDDFCAFEPHWSVPVSVAAISALTLTWALLAPRVRQPRLRFYQVVRGVVLASLLPSALLLVTWRSLLGVVTLVLMILVGASATYLALTRIAPASGAQHLGDEEGQLQ
ncbi:hypothetical protein GCM10010174_58820 [Kutzneria viridogrisea]|uniref:Uncharacterized protein n=2 Tax=Kutzneria TaxID=43356 RepID=A0ABR6BK54_9PSEU|nr:hypothetical protein [Kutzneria albida]AHH95368.1 putative secreted protein [Kutzneria albida DSM 43870]MBA8927275.1 hypothetical protein [Kutzneria viridogrisea]